MVSSCCSAVADAACAGGCYLMSILSARHSRSSDASHLHLILVLAFSGRGLTPYIHGYGAVSGKESGILFSLYCIRFGAMPCTGPGDLREHLPTAVAEFLPRADDERRTTCAKDRCIEAQRRGERDIRRTRTHCRVMLGAAPHRHLDDQCGKENALCWR